MSSSDPQPGPSSGVHRPIRGDDSFFEEVDIGLMVQTDEEANQLRATFKINNVILVSSAGWGATDGNNKDLKRNRLPDDEKKGHRKKPIDLSDRNNLIKALKAAKRKMEQLEEGTVAAQVVIREQAEVADRDEEEIKNLNAKLAESQAQRETIHNQLEKLNKQKGDEMRNLEAQLEKANQQFLSEKTARERLSREMAAVKRRCIEDRECSEKSQQERVEIEMNARTEKDVLNQRLRQACDLRMTDIRKEKEKTEELKVAQFRLMAKLREMAKLTEFTVSLTDDILSDNVLTEFSKHLVRGRQLAPAEKAELERNRLLIKQLENVFNTFRGSQQQLDQSQSQARGETPTYAAAVVAASPSHITVDSPCPNVTVENQGNVSPSQSNSKGGSASPLRDLLNSEPSLPPTPPQDDLPFRTPRIVNVESIFQKNIDFNTTPTAAGPSSPVESMVVEVVPKVEMMSTSVEEDEVKSSVAPSGPSIIIPLTTTAPTNPSLERPAPASPTPTVIVPRLSNANKRFRRCYKQMTPFCVTRKLHGVNRASSQFRCFCGNVYLNGRCLNVHIRKMTKEWKYKCEQCQQYFFYQSDLKRHQDTSNCGKRMHLHSPTPGEASPPPEHRASINSVDSFVAGLIGISRDRPEEQQPEHPLQPQTPPLVNNEIPTVLKSPERKRKKTKRKLQQEFMRRKKHVPWLSKKGSVQGNWYCSCGSKFSTKGGLYLHVQYFTKDWYFKCDHCDERFLYLATLKQHLHASHKLENPLSEFTVGCYLCGAKFQKRKEYYLHRKMIHNLQNIRPNRSRISGQPLTASQSSQRQTTVPPQGNPEVAEIAVIVPMAPVVEVIDVLSDDEDVVIVEPPANSNGPNVLSTSRLNKKKEIHAPVPRDPLANTQELPHIFDCVCGKSYQSRTALMSHTRKKTFGRVFVCCRCSHGFYTIQDLQTHMLGIHQETLREFKCGLCRQIFISPKLFTMHKHQDHANLM